MDDVKGGRCEWQVSSVSDNKVRLDVQLRSYSLRGSHPGQVRINADHPASLSRRTHAPAAPMAPDVKERRPWRCVERDRWNRISRQITNQVPIQVAARRADGLLHAGIHTIDWKYWLLGLRVLKVLQSVTDGPMRLFDVAEHHDRNVVDDRVSVRLAAHQPTLAQLHTAMTTRTDEMFEQPGIDHGATPDADRAA